MRVSVAGKAKSLTIGSVTETPVKPSWVQQQPQWVGKVWTARVKMYLPGLNKRKPAFRRGAQCGLVYALEIEQSRRVRADPKMPKNASLERVIKNTALVTPGILPDLEHVLWNRLLPDVREYLRGFIFGVEQHEAGRKRERAGDEYGPIAPTSHRKVYDKLLKNIPTIESYRHTPHPHVEIFKFLKEQGAFTAPPSHETLRKLLQRLGITKIKPAP